MAIGSRYVFQLDATAEDGRYVIRPLYQSGRHELLDQLVRFEENLWAKELMPKDLIDYRAFKICSHQDIYQWLPIAFEIPSGYKKMGIMKAKGLNDAVLFECHPNEDGGLRFEILVIDNENAKSMLYLEAMEEGFFEDVLGMLQVEG